MSQFPNIININYGCDGGSVLVALEYAMEKFISDEQSYPYLGY